MKELLKKFYEPSAEGKRKIVILICSVFAYLLTIIQFFIPYFGYPTTNGHESLLPINVFANLDYSNNLVTSIPETTIYLFIVCIIFFAVATKHFIGSAIGIKFNEQKLVISTKKITSLVCWLTGLYFVSAFYFTTLFNASGSNLLLEGTYIPFILSLIVKFVYNQFEKILVDLNGEDYIPLRENCKRKMTLTILLTFILVFVFVSTMASIGSGIRMLILVFVVLFACCAIVKGLNRDRKILQARRLKNQLEFLDRADKKSSYKPNSEAVWNYRYLKESNERVEIKEKISLLECNEKLYKKINASGISISEEEVKTLLSALASAKVVLLNVNNQSIVRKFSEVLCDCFSAQLFIDNYALATDANEEVSERDQMLNKKFGIESGVYTAYYMNKFIRPIFFEEFESEPSIKVQNYIEKVAEASEQIYLGRLNYLEENEEYSKGQMFISDNLFVFAFVNNSTLSHLLKEDWIQYATVVDLDLSEKETEDEQFNFEMLYEPFSQEVEEAQDTFYFNENSWAKLDKLEEYLTKTVGFGLKNRFLRQIEKFASTYIALGASQEQAIDAVLSTKILPWLAGKKEMLVSETVGDFALAIDEFFGNELIPCAKDKLVGFELKK